MAISSDSQGLVLIFIRFSGILDWNECSKSPIFQKPFFNNSLNISLSNFLSFQFTVSFPAIIRRLSKTPSSHPKNSRFSPKNITIENPTIPSKFPRNPRPLPTQKIPNTIRAHPPPKAEKFFKRQSMKKSLSKWTLYKSGVWFFFEKKKKIYKLKIKEEN